MELRNLVRTRHADLLLGLYSTMSSRDFLGGWEKVREEEFRDYTDAMKKVVGVKLNQVILLFGGMRVLLYRKLVDVGVVDDLFRESIKLMWEKAKPVLYDVREQLNLPTYGRYFEYLYNEEQKHIKCSS